MIEIMPKREKEKLGQFKVMLSGAMVEISRGQTCVLSDINFSVSSGQVLMIAGPNGSGKTSLLRAVAQLLNYVGDVRVNGAGVEATDIHFIGHRGGLKSRLSVEENLKFLAHLLGGSFTRQDMQAALSLWGATGLERRPVNSLSAGQYRRVALARLSLAPRPIWLLDEPFTALDQVGREILTEQITHHCAAGGVVMASSHEPLPFATTQLVLGESP